MICCATSSAESSSTLTSNSSTMTCSSTVSTSSVSTSSAVVAGAGALPEPAASDAASVNSGEEVDDGAGEPVALLGRVGAAPAVGDGERQRRPQVQSVGDGLLKVVLARSYFGTVLANWPGEVVKSKP
ncbi:hypothetical protein NLG97_g3969 [Lecanicillium saksenae]|uniref:Uncharacterized protein n=1 Tax=Lecanicillium saksenae TaxID=468837 RepID=A0ACC1QZT9_9HYPO|nr:hypothetical protein NLG97_g3969 [Lecanicillium saksenae]